MWNDLLALLQPGMASSPLAPMLLLALAGYFLVLVIVALALLILTIRLHRQNERTAQRWGKLEQAWRPELAQVLIGGWPAAKLHAHIRPEEGMLFVDFLTRSAQRLSGTSRQKLQELAAPWLQKLAARCENGDNEQRARAIFTLSMLAPDAYRPQIARALNDPVPMVAMLAARSLAENHAHEYLDLLLSRLERFQDWSRQSLTALLVQIAQSDPAPLRKALLSPQHPVWVQTVILRALIELDDPASVPLAVQILEADRDSELQAAALDLLARLGDASHKALIRSKCRAADFVIRLHALKALNHLGDSSDQALYSQMLEDDSHWVALQAAYGLREAGCLTALTDLAESEHPRAELAQQVLAELDADKFMQVAAHSSGFCQRVPAWIEDVLLHPSATAWRSVQQILFHPDTHPEVKLAIAESLTPDAAPAMYPAILRQLKLQTDTEPAYLYRALHHLNLLAASEILRKHFFTTSSDAARLEILSLLLKYHTPATWGFIRELRAGLESALSGFSAELSRNMQEQLDAFEQAQDALTPPAPAYSSL